MTLKCNNCKTEFPDHEPFCPRCGKSQLIVGEREPVQDKLDPASQAEVGNDASAPSGASDPTSTAGQRWTLSRAAGGCLLTFACVVLIFLAIGAVATYQGLQERAALTRQEAIVHYERGLAQLEAGQYEFAIAEFEHALRMDPAHREARDALRDAKTTALAQPTPTSATLNEAVIAILAEAEELVEAQKWSEAAQRLSELRDLAPNFETQRVSDLLYTAYFNFGTQLVSKGQVAEGISAFETALGERPSDPETSRELELASLYASAQAAWGADWPSTIGYLEQLHEQSPDYGDVREKLYQSYEAYGDDLVAKEAWCLAEQQYGEAVTLRPSQSIQAKWDDAIQVCRAPTPTPRPRMTPTRPIASARTITPSGTGAATSADAGPAITASTSGRILFSRFNNKNATWEIVAVNPTNGSLEVVLGDATQPAVSLNERLMAYHAEVDEAEGLHVLNLATGEDVRVTIFREDLTPDWSPDNLRFVFPSQRAGDRRWRIYVAWADAKGEAVDLAFGRTPAWSPDGEVIAFHTTDAQGNNPGLYLISPEGGPVARLTHDESDRAPAWSPNCRPGSLDLGNQGNSAGRTANSSADSCQLAFMSTRDGNWEIYLLDVFSGAVTRLTQSAGNDGLPAWSPDGTHIAFVSDRDGTWGIYTMPATGGTATRVADWDNEFTDWLLERIDWAR